MSQNRISRVWDEVFATRTTRPEASAFIAFEAIFAHAPTPWQQQLYRVAYERAQEAMAAPRFKLPAFSYN